MSSLRTMATSHRQSGFVMGTVLNSSRHGHLYRNNDDLEETNNAATSPDGYFSSDSEIESWQTLLVDLRTLFKSLIPMSPFSTPKTSFNFTEEKRFGSRENPLVLETLTRNVSSYFRHNALLTKPPKWCFSIKRIKLFVFIWDESSWPSSPSVQLTDC